jgi:hypothetical protein
MSRGLRIRHKRRRTTGEAAKENLVPETNRVYVGERKAAKAQKVTIKQVQVA